MLYLYMATQNVVNIGSGNCLLSDGTKPLRKQLYLSLVRFSGIHMRTIPRMYVGVGVSVGGVWVGGGGGGGVGGWGGGGGGGGGGGSQATFLYISFENFAFETIVSPPSATDMGEHWFRY